MLLKSEDSKKGEIKGLKNFTMEQMTFILSGGDWLFSSMVEIF